MCEFVGFALFPDYFLLDYQKELGKKAMLFAKQAVLLKAEPANYFLMVNVPLCWHNIFNLNDLTGCVNGICHKEMSFKVHLKYSSHFLQKIVLHCDIPLPSFTCLFLSTACHHCYFSCVWLFLRLTMAVLTPCSQPFILCSHPKVVSSFMPLTTFSEIRNDFGLLLDASVYFTCWFLWYSFIQDIKGNMLCYLSKLLIIDENCRIWLCIIRTLYKNFNLANFHCKSIFSMVQDNWLAGSADQLVLTLGFLQSRTATDGFFHPTNIKPVAGSSDSTLQLGFSALHCVSALISPSPPVCYLSMAAWVPFSPSFALSPFDGCVPHSNSCLRNPTQSDLSTSCFLPAVLLNVKKILNECSSKVMLGISVFPDVNARRLCGIFDEFAVFF